MPHLHHVRVRPPADQNTVTQAMDDHDGLSAVSRERGGMSEATRPTTVVFDLGGVLVDWDPRHLYRQLFDDVERRSRSWPR